MKVAYSSSSFPSNSWHFTPTSILSHSYKDHKLWKYSDFGLNLGSAIDRLFDLEWVINHFRPYFCTSKMWIITLISWNGCKGQLRSNVWIGHKLEFIKWRLVCNHHLCMANPTTWTLQPISQDPLEVALPVIFLVFSLSSLTYSHALSS